MLRRLDRNKDGRVEGALENIGLGAVRGVADGRAARVVSHDQVAVRVKGEAVGALEAGHETGLGPVRSEFINRAGTRIGFEQVPRAIDSQAGREVKPARKSDLRRAIR